MGKLYFRYGVMGSSKTANALMVRFNYLEKGKKVALIKQGIDTRDGKDIVHSRIGLEAECMDAGKFFLSNSRMNKKYDVIIVDEVQFLDEYEIAQLAGLADAWDIPVICYGLKTDFMGHLFEGSKRLLELADTIEEIPTICWCGKKAHFNARIKDGKVVLEGNQIELGGSDTYVSLCRKHFLSREIYSSEVK